MRLLFAHCFEGLPTYNVWRRRSVFATICLFFAASGFADTAKRIVSAEEVKAVFMVHFCRFSMWPNNVFVDSKTPIVVGIWGDDGFTELVKKAADGEQAGSRPILVRSIHAASEIQGVQLLFVAREVETQFERWHDDGLKNILIVGDTSRLLNAGGHIQFLSDGSKVKLRANPVALKRSAVSLSSNLLRIAQVSSLP